MKFLLKFLELQASNKNTIKNRIAEHWPTFPSQYGPYKEAEKIAISFLFLLLRRRHRRSQRVRNHRVKPWILTRLPCFTLLTSFIEDKDDNPKSVTDLIGMDGDGFFTILNLVSPYIKKQDTNMRPSTSRGTIINWFTLFSYRLEKLLLPCMKFFLYFEKQIKVQGVLLVTGC